VVTHVVIQTVDPELRDEWDSVEAHRSANRTPAHDRLMAETIDKYRTAPSDYAHFEAEEI
jgi:hypothetical protein